MKKSFNAWAIQSIDNGSLLGRYFFNQPLPDCLEGCRTALFSTRAIARKYSKTTYYKTKAVKVIVTIKVIK